jgi:peptide/nickel transport system permease protein
MAEATIIAVRRQHTWLSFLARRIGRLVISLAVVLSLSFLLIQFIPGDPVRLALGPTAPASMVAQQRAALGLTKPLGIQYLDYWHDVLTGHLGSSIVSGQSVGQIIATSLPETAELVGVALVLTMIFSVSIGVLAGALTHQGRRPRLLLFFTSATSILNTIPEFLLGVGLVFVFAVTLKLLPVAGASGWQSLVLPALAIAIGPTAGLARIVRVQTDVVLAQDYMRVARAKRLPTWIIYLRHALPNLLTAALTIGGLLLGTLVASSVVVENVFARPGLGTAIVQAITQHDYPVIQGILLVLGAAVLVLNLLVDLVLSALDPRSTLRES